jgi:ABC-type lipoprotein release transport system permease subunit
MMRRGTPLFSSAWGLVTAVAALIPAHRAAKLDPLQILRQG